MNKQEILTFINLHAKFQERCRHIAEILYVYDCDFKESWGNDWELDYADCYAENKFYCYMSVDIYARGCHIDSRSLSFPVELLSANEAQIHEYALSKYKST